MAKISVTVKTVGLLILHFSTLKPYLQSLPFYSIQPSSRHNAVKRPTVLVERLKGSFHYKDIRLILFDAEFYALFDGVMFKIDVLQFFKICLLLMLSAEQLQMRLPIHVSHHA